MKMILATGNKGKLKEARLIFSGIKDCGVEIISPLEASCDMSGIEETGSTFFENALIKAKAVWERTHVPAIADDSGLIVEALSGEGVRAFYEGEKLGFPDGFEEPGENLYPGVVTARFFDTVSSLFGYPSKKDEHPFLYGALAEKPGEEETMSILSDVEENVVSGDKNEMNYRLLLSLLDGEKSRKAFFVSCCAAYFGDGRYVSSYGICCGSISEKPFIANGFGYDPVFFLDGMGMMISELSDAEKNAISHRGKAMRRLGEKLALIKN